MARREKRPDALRPRGLRKVRRAPALRERGGEALTRALEERLFAVAEVLTEGARREVGDDASFFGSTMITVDLAEIARGFRGIETPEEQERLRALVEGSVRVRLRAMRLACAEVARRIPGETLGTAQVETRVSLVDGHLHLDVEFEVPYGARREEREA